MAQVLFQGLQTIGTNVEANVPLPEGARSLDSVRIAGMVYSVSGGQPGTADYAKLTNKPSIDGHVLIGDLSLSAIGAASIIDIDNLRIEIDDSLMWKSVQA